MLGLLRGRRWSGKRPDMFHPDDELRHQASRLRVLPTFADICRASVAAEDANRLWLFRRKDGEERIMRMTLTAVPDQSGELSGYLATAEDVTEREAAHAGHAADRAAPADGGGAAAGAGAGEG